MCFVENRSCLCLTGLTFYDLFCDLLFFLYWGLIQMHGALYHIIFFLFFLIILPLFKSLHEVFITFCNCSGWLSPEVKKCHELKNFTLSLRCVYTTYRNLEWNLNDLFFFFFFQPAVSQWNPWRNNHYPDMHYGCIQNCLKLNVWMSV